MGLVGGILALVVALIMLVRILTLFKYSWFRMYRNLESKIFYNPIIRYFLTSMLKLMVAAATSIVFITDR